MELDARLRAYGAFVRRKSFSGAASELRISQPAVSKHIADLERELGVKLIERRTRSLTEAGEYLAGHVVRAEALLKQSVRGLASLRDPTAGAVSIIASGTPGTYVLPRIVAAVPERASRRALSIRTRHLVGRCRRGTRPSRRARSCRRLHSERLNWKPNRCSRMRSWWSGRRTFRDGG